MTNVTPLPWHRTLWKDLYNAAKCNKLHHALLLEGVQGTGKTEFIQSFAQLLLCKSPRLSSKDEIYQSCGQCADCLLYKANTHPNYYALTYTLSNANKPFISIEQVRHLINALQNTSMSRPVSTAKINYHTVVFINSADTLQLSSIHALLKSLEEPNLGILFLLESAKPQTLLATLKSRCQSKILPISSKKESFSWLQHELGKTNQKINQNLLAFSLEVASGVPLKAFNYLKTNEIDNYRIIFSDLAALKLQQVSPTEIIKQWSHYSVNQLLDYLMFAIFRFVLLSLDNTSSDKDYLGASKAMSHQLMERLHLNSLLADWDQLSDIRYEANLYTLNETLILERLVYSFSS